MLRTDVLRSMPFVEAAISVAASPEISGSLIEAVYEVLRSDQGVLVLRRPARPYEDPGFLGRHKALRYAVGMNFGSGYLCLSLGT